MTYLYLVAEIYPDPKQREEALAHYLELVAASKAETGCLMYDLVVNPDQPDSWLMLEKWESQEIWGKHMKTNHVVKIQSLEKELLAKPTKLNFYQAV